ncbi:MAG: hypothetical protein D6689_02290 [Deltaproteobacteria bacterium]|nr:MAG: hypothetical protein D6689_02290 [Deltaproteobacteria bacterium]
MDRIRALWIPPRRWPALITVAATVVLILRLGSYGFWDPHEIRVADRARAVADGKSVTDVVPGEPPLTRWLVGTSVAWFGPSELGARLPVALLGILAVAATALLGTRIGSPRAGAFAGLALLGTPMLVFESRQLVSAIGATAGGAILVLGASGLLWPPGRRAGARRALYAVDLAAAVDGAALAHASVGSLAGVFAPIAALATATAFAAAGAPRDQRRRLSAGTALAALAAAACLAWVVLSVFDWVEAPAGDRALFGYTLRAHRGYSAALGGTWRTHVPQTVTWDALFEQIAFGFFPWIALAPVALGRAALGRGDRRATWAGQLAFFWAFGAWLAGTVLALKSGPVRYAGFPALAVAVGLWLDDLLAAREARGGAPRDMPAGAPLAAAAAFIVCVMLGKDLKAFPDKLAGLHLLEGSLAFPKTAPRWLTAVPLAFGIVVGGALWAGVSGPGRVLASIRRRGVAIAVAAGVAFGATLAWVYIPKLSESLSYKYLFDRYRDLGGDGAPLGVLGVPGSGPDYYARGKVEKLRNRNDLFALLRRPERTFALAPRTDLCAIHQASLDGSFDYYVLDDSHAKFLLLSNRLPDGWTGDDNPLKKWILRERPADIGTPLDINFDDTLRLVGVSMPSEVRRGDTFEVALYFEVLKKPRRNWKVFLHFDGAGMRFQGDHWPLDHTCGTVYWQPGDFIVDRYTVTAGDMTTPKATYQAWAGLFVGSSGNWTNMPVKSGDHDDANRVRIGAIRLR